MSLKKSVLVVDDSHELPARIEYAFRLVRPGTAVFPLPSGERALEHLIECGERFPLPDLVLLDSHMPGGMDGFETLRCIRRVERLLPVHILIISGSGEEDEVARAHDAGADGYLVKPVATDQMMAFARDVLAWRPQESWREVEPRLSGTGLVDRSLALGSVPSMALQSSAAALIPPVADDVLQRFLGFLDYCKEQAVQAIDPLQAALSRACRRHCITPLQVLKGGGSQPMIANRRAVLVDLINEGWPDETLSEVAPLSKSEFKRLRKAAREKVGPKLGLLGKRSAL